MKSADLPPVTWLLEKSPHFTDPERMGAWVNNPVFLTSEELAMRKFPLISGPVVAYGTLRGMTHLLGSPLAHAVFDHYDLLTCSSYYRFLHDLLGRRAFILPLAALPEANLDQIFPEGCFVRPDSNKKPFEAQKLDSSTLADFMEKYRHLRAELVVISDPLPIEREYRCFCRNGEVFAHSTYMETPYGPARPRIIRMAQEVAKTLQHYLGLTMVTVDIARVPRRLALLEVGGVNSWGLYGGEESAFIQAMEDEARQVYADIHPS